MKVGIIFGNGFDIEMGLKTSFHDFYEHEKNCDNKILNLIHEELQHGGDKQLWSDFESSFGEKFEYLEKKYNNEENLLLNEFIDFRSRFRKYLIEQQNQISEEQKEFIQNECDSIFTDSIDNIINSMSAEQKKNLEQIVQKEENNTKISFDAVDKKPKYDINLFTFNYTTYLPLDIRHLHDDINHGMFIGVDNVEQINTSRDLSVEEQKIYIKPQSLQKYVELTSQENKELIRNNDIIILHGLALGETDASWWNLLSDLSMGKKIIIISFYLSEEEYKQYLEEEYFTKKIKEERIIQKITKHATEYLGSPAAMVNKQKKHKLVKEKNFMVHFHNGSLFSLNPKRYNKEKQNEVIKVN